MNDPRIKERPWKEFQETGLLLIINQILHIFGWAIVMELKDGTVIKVYPARVKFRGFNNKSTDRAYENITQYMVDNADILYNEVLP